MPEIHVALQVRITTAKGDVFLDSVDSAELRTADGSIRLVPNQHAYLLFEGASSLCLRQGVAAYVTFHLRNAVAHVSPRHLRIVAEEVQQSNT